LDFSAHIARRSPIFLLRYLNPNDFIAKRKYDARRERNLEGGKDKQEVETLALGIHELH
jgi:hypothetical protein